MGCCQSSGETKALAPREMSFFAWQDLNSQKGWLLLMSKHAQNFPWAFLCFFLTYDPSSIFAGYMLHKCCSLFSLSFPLHLPHVLLLLFIFLQPKVSVSSRHCVCVCVSVCWAGDTVLKMMWTAHSISFRRWQSGTVELKFPFYPPMFEGCWEQLFLWERLLWKKRRN